MKRKFNYTLFLFVSIIICFSSCRKYDYSYLEEDVAEEPEMTEPGLIVSPETVQFDATAEPKGITVKALGGEWTVEVGENSKDWVVEVTPNKGGDGNTVVGVRVKYNNDMNEKEGFITIKQPATNTSIKINLKQFTHESKFTRRSDSLALVTMFKALGGESESAWRNPWNLKKPMTEWTGVTLKEIKGEMRVCELRMMEYGMTGEIVTEVGNLRELTFLKMQGGSITRVVPSSIANLRKLETIDINFSENVSFFVPENIGEMVSLNYLNIGSVTIDMTSFSRLYAIPNLETFICRSVSIAGNLPEGISKWKNLKVLNISSSNVAALPSGMGQLTKLEELNLSSCAKLVDLSTGFGQLVALKTLNLISCSKLNGLPEDIGNLPSLTSVSISSCEAISKLPDSFTKLRLTGEFSLYGCEGLTELPSTIGDMNGITDFDFTNCKKLARLPESICNLSGLKKLGLGGCESLTSLPDNIGNLSSLNEISISYTNITRLPASFGNLTAMEKISISSSETTKIGGVAEELFSKMESLTQLDASSNAFTGSLLFLKNLKKLKTVNLSRNNMDGAINFEELPTSLNTITLNDNRITGTIKGISRLVNLVTLTMTNNRLSGNIYAEIGSCTKLKNVYLSDNDIEGGIPEEIINFTPNTWAIILKNNKLSGEIPATVLNSAKWKSWNPATNIYPQKAGYGFSNVK